MKALFAVAALWMLSGAALANHECRREFFNTAGGRVVRFVPISPGAHCTVRVQRVSRSESQSAREARIREYYNRSSGSRASPHR